jgi:hypothetical protein
MKKAMWDKLRASSSRALSLRSSSTCLAVLLLSSAPAWAWPTTDECSAGKGCITTSSGGSGQFEYFIKWTVSTSTQQGTLSYFDSKSSLQVSSSTATDYSVIGPYARAFAFAANGGFYDEVRIFVSDNGSAASSDSFEIQLLQNGNIVYQEGNALEDACGGGVSISGSCSGNSGGTSGSGGSGGPPEGGPGNPPPPPAECDDFITGGGWILTTSGDKANFGIHGGIRNGSFWGGLNYIDHGTKMHVSSTATTAYLHLTEVGREIHFDVTIDGTPGKAVVKVYDNGEPGRRDSFDIQLSDGYHEGGTLAAPHKGGGNIQLHKAHCDKGKP